MSSIFTKIISGEIPSYKVAETEDFLAFLELFDLDEASYTKLLQFSRKVAIAIEKAIDCKRVGMTVIGLEVPHAHVHLIPLNTMDNARFIEKVKLSPEEFEATAKAINSYL